MKKEHEKRKRRFSLSVWVLPCEKMSSVSTDFIDVCFNPCFGGPGPGQPSKDWLDLQAPASNSKFQSLVFQSLVGLILSACKSLSTLQRKPQLVMRNGMSPQSMSWVYNVAGKKKLEMIWYKGFDFDF
mgnify:CR=1 FL=1